MIGGRVVVTGGAGFVGSHVVERLLPVAERVRIVDDLSAGARSNVAEDVELVVGDVRDGAFMDRALAGSDVVIHMACDNLRASLEDPRHTHEVNATGTLETALAASRAGAGRLVYVSSAEVYGSAVRVPMDEDHPLRPTTVYGASKAAGELNAQACMRTYGLPVTVVRLFNAYGPRSHEDGSGAEAIPRFVKRARSGRPPVIFGDGRQTRDLTWVGETAEGIVAATACDELVGGAVNIGSGHGVSIARLCAIVLEALGRPDLAPLSDTARPGDVSAHVADVTKARTLLGFEAQVTIEDGVARYVEWLESGSLSRSA